MIVRTNCIHCTVAARCMTVICHTNVTNAKDSVTATNCNHDQVCSKCSGNHRYKDCASTDLKCNNCANKGHSETNHKTYDATKCAVYKEEMAKAKNNTDHGIE